MSTTNELQTVEQSPRAHRRATPPTDIFESGEGFTLLVDLPGVTNDGLELTLEKDVLTIEGRRHDVDPAQTAKRHVEYEPRDWFRQFTLSFHVDREQIQAKLKDGVLELFLPKGEADRPRRINVRSA